MHSRSNAVHRAHAGSDAPIAHAATADKHLLRASALKSSQGSAKFGGPTVGVGGLVDFVETDGGELADAVALADADNVALPDTESDALAELDGLASAVNCDSRTAQRNSVRRILYNLKTRLAAVKP